jgi:hypothetical protein
VTNEQLAALTNLTGLQELTLVNSNSLTMASTSLFVQLALTKLHLIGCQWVNDTIGERLQHRTLLRELSLRDCESITVVRSLSFVDALDISGCWQVPERDLHALVVRVVRVYRQYCYVSNELCNYSYLPWRAIVEKSLAKRDLRAVWEKNCYSHLKWL